MKTFAIITLLLQGCTLMIGKCSVSQSVYCEAGAAVFRPLYVRGPCESDVEAECERGVLVHFFPH